MEGYTKNIRILTISLLSRTVVSYHGAIFIASTNLPWSSISCVPSADNLDRLCLRLIFLAFLIFEKSGKILRYLPKPLL